MPDVGLVEAASDPQLFGSGISLWPKQREWLGCVEAGPRIHVIAAGRRATKTTTAALVAGWMCLLVPEVLEFLRPGERGYATCIAPTRDQARLFVKAVRSLVESSPLLNGMIEGASEDELRFRNRTGVKVQSCTSGARGWPIFFLGLDEFAWHQDADGRSVAESVWQSAVPSTAQFGDLARIMAMSTHSSEDSFFAELWDKAEEGELEGARAYTATSAEANPTLTEAFLKSERQSMGEEKFAIEYLAERRTGGGAFFDRDAVRQCVRRARQARPEEGSSWVCALDPSSGGGDAFGMVIVGRDARKNCQGRLLVGKTGLWRSDFSAKKGAGYRSQAERDRWLNRVLDEVAEQARPFNATIITDQHMPGIIIEGLIARQAGRALQRPWTTASRNNAFQSCRYRIDTGTIDLLDDAVLLKDLRRIRVRFREGSTLIVVPRSAQSHGELALALAAGVYELDSFMTQTRKASFGRAGATQLPRQGRIGGAW